MTSIYKSESRVFVDSSLKNSIIYAFPKIHLRYASLAEKGIATILKRLKTWIMSK